MSVYVTCCACCNTHFLYILHIGATTFYTYYISTAVLLYILSISSIFVYHIILIRVFLVPTSIMQSPIIAVYTPICHTLGGASVLATYPRISSRPPGIVYRRIGV